jgi:hypothetical protein
MPAGLIRYTWKKRRFVEDFGRSRAKVSITAPKAEKAHRSVHIAAQRRDNAVFQASLTASPRAGTLW